MFELSTPLFWILMPIVLAIYWMGVFAGKASERVKGQADPNGSKYWWDCKDCVPGGNYRIGADTKSHLDQMIQWHEDDHHEEEKEEWVPTASSTSWLAEQRTRLRSSSESFTSAISRVKRRLTLPAYRSVTDIRPPMKLTNIVGRVKRAWTRVLHSVSAVMTDIRYKLW